MEVKPYVMTWQGGANPSDVDLETRIALYGPYLTEEEAKDWGKWWQEETNDDPRWQVVMLSEEWIEDRGDKFLIVPILSAV